MSTLPRTTEEVKRTIGVLRSVKFATDPLVDARASRMASIVSSAYKRHGFILEHALLERLQQCPGLQVWDDRSFRIPQGADHVAASSVQKPASLIGVEHPYGEGARTIQVDLLVFNRSNKRLSAYEVKRGTGFHDAGKRRSILRDLLCTQLLLKSYGKEEHRLPVKDAESKIIFYYGKKSIDAPFSLQREELDNHFQFDVVKQVEEINALYRDQLASLLFDVENEADGETFATSEDGSVVDLSTIDLEVDLSASDAENTPEIAHRKGFLSWVFGKKGG